MDMQKRKPGRPKGGKNKPKEDPREIAVVDKLLNTPKTMPIREHPYVLFLAQKWETLEEQIEKLKGEQWELKQATEEFEKTYPVNWIETPAPLQCNVLQKSMV